MMKILDEGISTRPGLYDPGESRTEGSKGQGQEDSESNHAAILPTGPPVVERDSRPMVGRASLIMAELLATERHYVQDLQSLLTGYHGPLSASLEASDLAVLFGNLAELHAFHEELLSKCLQCHANFPRYVGECFTSMGERFLIYTRYYTNHPRAIELLQERQEDPEFFQLLLDCQMKLGHMLPLGDYLLKPVQRFLKYPLLLRELLKATEESGSGHDELLAADTLLKDVAGQINEIKWKNEMTEFVDELQQHLVKRDGGANLHTYGRLLNAGNFKASDAVSKRSDRYVVLFEGALVVCKFHANGMASIKHIYQTASFQSASVLHDPTCFQIISTDSKKLPLVVHCRDLVECEAWVNDIKNILFSEAGMTVPPEMQSTETSPSSTRRFQRPAVLVDSAAKKKKATTPKKRLASTTTAPLSPPPTHKSRRAITYSLSDLDNLRPDEQPPQSPGFSWALRKPFWMLSPKRNTPPVEGIPSSDQQHQESQALSSLITPNLAGGRVKASRECVICCCFPDSTHTSVLVKSSCTVADVFANRLANRGYSVDECILRITSTSTEAAGLRADQPLDWQADAFSALEGVMDVSVVKVKSRTHKVVFGTPATAQTTNTEDSVDAETCLDGHAMASPATALGIFPPCTAVPAGRIARSIDGALESPDWQDAHPPCICLTQPSSERLVKPGSFNTLNVTVLGHHLPLDRMHSQTDRDSKSANLEDDSDLAGSARTDSSSSDGVDALPSSAGDGVENDGKTPLSAQSSVCEAEEILASDRTHNVVSPSTTSAQRESLSMANSAFATDVVCIADALNNAFAISGRHDPEQGPRRSSASVRDRIALWSANGVGRTAPHSTPKRSGGPSIVSPTISSRVMLLQSSASQSNSARSSIPRSQHVPRDKESMAAEPQAPASRRRFSLFPGPTSASSPPSGACQLSSPIEIANVDSSSVYKHSIMPATIATMQSTAQHMKLDDDTHQTAAQARQTMETNLPRQKTALAELVVPVVAPAVPQQKDRKTTASAPPPRLLKRKSTLLSLPEVTAAVVEDKPVITRQRSGLPRRQSGTPRTPCADKSAGASVRSLVNRFSLLSSETKIPLRVSSSKSAATPVLLSSGTSVTAAATHHRSNNSARPALRRQISVERLKQCLGSQKQSVYEKDSPIPNDCAELSSKPCPRQTFSCQPSAAKQGYLGAQQMVAPPQFHALQSRRSHEQLYGAVNIRERSKVFQNTPQQTDSPISRETEV